MKILTSDMNMMKNLRIQHLEKTWHVFLNIKLSVLQIDNLKACKSEACWFATGKLLGLQLKM